jgi:hypothetical protein
MTHVQALQAATELAATGDFTPNSTLNKARALLLLGISLVLIWITLAALAGHARKGNTRKIFDIVGATLLALIPGAIGIAGTGLAFAAAFLGWSVPFLSK